MPLYLYPCSRQSQWALYEAILDMSPTFLYDNCHNFGQVQCTWKPCDQILKTKLSHVLWCLRPTTPNTDNIASDHVWHILIFIPSVSYWILNNIEVTHKLWSGIMLSQIPWKTNVQSKLSSILSPTFHHQIQGTHWLEPCWHVAIFIPNDSSWNLKSHWLTTMLLVRHNAHENPVTKSLSIQAFILSLKPKVHYQTRGILSQAMLDICSTLFHKFSLESQVI